jgi:lauroyl/myristoyl acyltransferase
MLSLLAFRAIGALADALPRSVQYAIARRAGDLYYLCDRTARNNVKENLRGVHGDKVSPALIRRQARWIFRSFGMYLCEFFGQKRFGREFIDKHVVIQGREHLDAAMQRGKGVIFCPAHYSNWEMGASIVAHMGYPITIIAQMHDDPKVNELFFGQREKRGIHVVPSQHGAKGALKALRQNHTVALMGDRTTGGPVVGVKLFGKLAYLPQGPWRIALTSGAALLPTFIHRRLDGGLTLNIGAPLEVPQTGTIQERMALLAQSWTHCFERRLLIDPGQWAVFTKVWADTMPQLPGKLAATSSSEVTLEGGKTERGQ